MVWLITWQIVCIQIYQSLECYSTSCNCLSIQQILKSKLGNLAYVFLLYVSKETCLNLDHAVIEQWRWNKSVVNDFLCLFLQNITKF